FLTCHLALQRRLIKLIFTYLHTNHINIGFIHINHICEWIENGRVSSQLELPNNVIIRKEYEHIVFTLKAHESPVRSAFHYALEIPGRTYIPDIKAWIVTRMYESPGCLSNQNEDVAQFDVNEIKGNLIVRNRQNGDRMDPFGMEGSKKIKD